MSKNFKAASSIYINISNCTCPQLIKLEVYLKTSILYWAQEKHLCFNMSSFNSYKLTIKTGAFEICFPGYHQFDSNRLLQKFSTGLDNSNINTTHLPHPLTQ